MKVYVSADLEGICGVTSLEQIRPGGADYAKARQWMTEDVNAAVAGILEAGTSPVEAAAGKAGTFSPEEPPEIWVRDAHGPATNIDPDRLHPAARLMAGWTPVLDMLQGLDRSFDLAFFVGYHPGPFAMGGVLSHTYSMRTIRDVCLQGVHVGETLINAVQAGVIGVPVGLITGERALREEIREVLTEAEFVETKVGFGYQSALLSPVTACREQIQRAARLAVARTLAGNPFPAYSPIEPVRARVDFHVAEAASASLLVPGVERIDSRSIYLAAKTAAEFIHRFQLLTQVLYGVRI